MSSRNQNNLDVDGHDTVNAIVLDDDDDDIDIMDRLLREMVQESAARANNHVAASTATATTGTRTGCGDGPQQNPAAAPKQPQQEQPAMRVLLPIHQLHPSIITLARLKPQASLLEHQQQEQKHAAALLERQRQQQQKRQKRHAAANGGEGMLVNSDRNFHQNLQLQEAQEAAATTAKERGTAAANHTKNNPQDANDFAEQEKTLKMMSSNSTMLNQSMSVNNENVNNNSNNNKHNNNSATQDNNHQNKFSPENTTNVDDEDTETEEEDNTPMNTNNDNDDYDCDEYGRLDRGGDIVLVPADPRRNAPSIAARGSIDDEILGRRKRLFAAKSILMANPNNQKRRKRVAYKSVSRPQKTTINREEYLKQRERCAEALNYPLPDPPKHQTKKKTSTGSSKKSSHKTNNNTTTTSSSSTGHTQKSASTSGACGGARDDKGRLAPVEVYRGPPDEPLLIPGGWPAGWIKTMVERRSGSCKGTKDRYWWSPEGRKFRSFTEVQKFFAAMALPEIQHDEAAAWKIFRSIQLN